MPSLTGVLNKSECPQRSTSWHTIPRWFYFSRSSLSHSTVSANAVNSASSCASAAIFFCTLYGEKIFLDTAPPQNIYELETSHQIFMDEAFAYAKNDNIKTERRGEVLSNWERICSTSSHFPTLALHPRHAPCFSLYKKMKVRTALKKERKMIRNMPLPRQITLTFSFGLRRRRLRNCPLHTIITHIHILVDILRITCNSVLPSNWKGKHIKNGLSWKLYLYFPDRLFHFKLHEIWWDPSRTIPSGEHRTRLFRSSLFGAGENQSSLTAHNSDAVSILFDALVTERSWCARCWARHFIISCRTPTS